MEYGRVDGKDIVVPNEHVDEVEKKFITEWNSKND